MTELDFARVEPRLLEAWLSVDGWQRLAVADNFSDWSDTVPPTDVVRVMRQAGLDDYAARVRGALSVVAETRGRPIQSVLSEVIEAGMDRVQFRSIEDVDGAGAIEVLGGVRFIDGIKQLLVAGAKAAHESRPYFGQRSWQHGREFLESARLGQTSVGSYVVTVLSHVLEPMEPRTTGAMRLPNLPHNDRYVVTRLMGSLVAARDVVDIVGGKLRIGSDEDESVIEGVSRGVSADLCDALVAVAKGSTRESVDVSVRWSPILAPFLETPNKVSFSQSDIESLEAVSGSLRDIRPKRVQVAGFVEQLARLEGVRGGPGLITLKTARSGGGLRSGATVRVALNADDHNRAIQAYELGVRLDIRGDLTRSGNRNWITNGEIFGQALNKLVLRTGPNNSQ